MLTCCDEIIASYGYVDLKIYLLLAYNGTAFTFPISLGHCFQVVAASRRVFPSPQVSSSTDMFKQ